MNSNALGSCVTTGIIQRHAKFLGPRMRPVIFSACASTPTANHDLNTTGSMRKRRFIRSCSRWSLRGSENHPCHAPAGQASNDLSQALARIRMQPCCSRDRPDPNPCGPAAPDRQQLRQDRIIQQNGEPQARHFVQGACREINARRSFRQLPERGSWSESSCCHFDCRTR